MEVVSDFDNLKDKNGNPIQLENQEDYFNQICNMANFTIFLSLLGELNCYVPMPCFIGNFTATDGIYILFFKASSRSWFDPAMSG